MFDKSHTSSESAGQALLSRSAPSWRARVNLDGVPCGEVTTEQAAVADNRRRRAFNTMREAQKVR